VFPSASKYLLKPLSTLSVAESLDLPSWRPFRITPWSIAESCVSGKSSSAKMDHTSGRVAVESHIHRCENMEPPKRKIDSQTWFRAPFFCRSISQNGFVLHATTACITSYRRSSSEPCWVASISCDFSEVCESKSERSINGRNRKT
jgi:hypothetical protein